jgi:AcrR family transcriptional regulator
MPADEATPAKSDGRQSRWSQHNEVRRRVIIDAAIEVLGESEPGAEVHVQQIADRAGLSRTVVYRHFNDRADLDAAVQGAVLEALRTELVPSLSFEGTPVEIIRRIVAAYVGWAAAHPALHEFAQADPPGEGPGQMERAIGHIAGQVEDLINVGVQVLHVDLREHEVQALDPLVFGLVGAVFTSVRRWLSRPERRPTAEQFVDLATEAIWFQIAGMAAARGVVLDPDVPVERLLEAALDGAE